MFVLNSKSNYVSNNISHFQLPEKFLNQLMDDSFGNKGYSSFKNKTTTNDVWHFKYISFSVIGKTIFKYLI